MKGLSKFFNDPASLVLSILVALSLLGAWTYAKQTPGIDYYVAWVAADAVRNDTPNNIYEPISGFRLAVSYRNKADEMQDNPRQKRAAQALRELHMTATPFLYWVTGLIATGDYEKDLDVWHGLALFSLVASVLVIGRLLGYSLAARLALLLPLVVWFAPLQADLRVGNVNSFQLGLVGLALWLQARKPDNAHLFAAGLVAGLLVMFKPNLAAIAILLAGGWLLRGQFRKAVVGISGMATAAIGAVLVSSWWLGSATAWLDWLKLISKTLVATTREGSGNLSVMSEVAKAAGGANQPDLLDKFNSIGKLGATGQLTVVLCLCLVCLALFWWGLRRHRAPGSDQADHSREITENALLVAMGCLVTMLVSGIVWSHYYMLTIPMLLVALRPWHHPDQAGLLPLLMLRVLPAIALVCLLNSVLPGMLGIEAARYWAIATMASVFILFAVGLWQFGYGISDRAVPQPAGAPAAR